MEQTPRNVPGAGGGQDQSLGVQGIIHIYEAEWATYQKLIELSRGLLATQDPDYENYGEERENLFSELQGLEQKAAAGRGEVCREHKIEEFTVPNLMGRLSGRLTEGLQTVIIGLQDCVKALAELDQDVAKRMAAELDTVKSGLNNVQNGNLLKHTYGAMPASEARFIDKNK